MKKEFQRARSDEQRQVRKKAILATVRDMLEKKSERDISLNEIARQVGLAKSNVLRYFESREAILLELLDQEVKIWVQNLEEEIGRVQGSAPEERAEALATVLADSLRGRPVLCDLTQVESSVLERNISVDSIIRHKRASRESGEKLANMMLAVLPELDKEKAQEVVIAFFFAVVAAWPYTRPSQAMQQVYEGDFQVVQFDFFVLVQRSAALALKGLLAEAGRW